MWEVISNYFGLLNTNFSAALLGAFSGAIIAQYVSDKAEKKADVVKQLRSINVAKSLAYNICTQLLTYKGYQLHHTLEKFDRLKTIYQKGIDEHINDQIFEAMDLPTFSTPQICLDEFKNITLNNITISPRAISCIYLISDCYAELKLTIERREDFIKNIKGRIEANDKDLLNLIFGLRTKDGNVDGTFSHSNHVISYQTDNLIFFSNLILQDLEKLESDIIIKNKFYSENYIVQKSLNNFSESIWLFPDVSEYDDWLKTFPEEDYPLHHKMSE